MHRFHSVPALLAVAALLAADPAHGRATTSATLADFHIGLTDLDPSDGVTPSLTLDPQAYSIVGVMASSDVDLHSSRGDWAFSPVSTSRAVDGSGGSASFSGDPFGAGAVITASAFADNGGGASSNASVDGPPAALYFGDFVLGPRSQVTFSGSGSIDWSASGAYPSTYAALGVAFLRIIDGQQDWVGQDYLTWGYNGLGAPTGTISAPVELSFANTGDALVVVIYTLGVAADAIDAQIDSPSPIDEPAGAALLLAGLPILLWRARRRR